MRLHDIIVEQKLWYNTLRRTMLEVPETHVDMVIDTPEHFGLTRRDIESVDEIIAVEDDFGERGDLLLDLALRRGWVRVDVEHDRPGGALPYITAHSHQLARQTLRELIRRGLVQFRVMVEVQPVPGEYGWVRILEGNEVDAYVRGRLR